MQIVLYVIGKTNQEGVLNLIEEYLKRLKKFVKFSIHTLPDVKSSGSLSKDVLIEKEGTQFINNLKKDDFVVLLDENGKQFSSVKFSIELQKIIQNTRGRIVFIIGGAYGFSEEVYNHMNTSISLSSMTFNHQMVRAIFCEQLYRAFTIIKGMPYHHE